ncbi:MAG: UDP-N-acetylmuramoyl-L-alanyl-D-glutamate--2,6-diaminopimelate ligase [Bacteroidales bacterium]|nr:UDP-N-acetylmuramoyl-L-alanyl-D-glutamate--2,6-diaminopimelate ligase [Bacteroidales bacterium]MBQ7819354.1 UDP-N-acetylmuramoyl-L-alanyl-D-glutamate--2,6-diaminopimelate ligase [Bacteroidales bacterium]
MKNLSELLEKIKILEIYGEKECEILGIDSDSRNIKPKYMFIAVKGTAVDGHKYIDKAIELGATAIVCEDLPENRVDGVTYIHTSDSHKTLGELASAWFNYPSSKLKLVGVTGTNGKTTIATLLYKMFKMFGEKVGLLSTVCNYIGDNAISSTHTTPDPISLNSLLSQMVDEGCTYAFMEVSSHSADQKRIAGLEFDGGIFTNLTRDHMDYHKTVDAYLKAKKSFFDSLNKSAFALTNGDDKNGMVMLQNCKAKKSSYSLQSIAEFKGKIIESRIDGTTLQINGKEVETLFVGKFNAYNLLAVYGATCLLGKNPEEVLTILSALIPVSGRFQTLSKGGITAIVDYAHTPDAITNVLQSINEVIRNKGNIISVIGAGGNRDKGKRPIMAQEAAKLSSQLILTSDNPRDEEPEQIISEMKEGLSAVQAKKAISITDRREAIRLAIRLAKPGDVVLVAGKGHEDYQEIKGVKYHFDDREEIENAFEELI